MILKLYAKKLLTNQIAGILNIYWHGCDYVALNYKEVLLKEIAVWLSVICTVSFFAPWNTWKNW